jgi:hypothetical protein
MKLKSSCSSAFLNPPILVGLLSLAGIFLALIGSGTFSNAAAQFKHPDPDQHRFPNRRSASKAARSRSFVPVLRTDASSGTTLCTWSNFNPGPVARYRAGGVTDGTYIYVFGGGDEASDYLSDLWRWDPFTQTWTQLANMPTGKQNIQGAYWNGKIYVPGGYIGSHITENAIYDIATNTWTTGAPLPATQTGQTVAFNNKIYNFGGNPGPQNTTSIYDIATNTWSTGAPMPVATTYGRATVSGPYAYYVGGIAGGTTTTNAVYRYDFAADSWTALTPLQTARTSEELMTSPDGSKLFAVMGGGPPDFFTGVPVDQSVEIYDIAANSWSYGNPVVTTAAAPAGGLAGSKAMVQGGLDDGVGATYDIVQVSAVAVPPCPTPTPIPDYVVSSSGGESIVPGTTDIGIHCDACTASINLPFPVQFYDRVFTSANVSSKGLIQFTSNNDGCCGYCLPQSFVSDVIAAHWSNLSTADAASGQGVFTSVSGTAPNRIFNIEWRATYAPNNGPPTQNFEVRLYESENRIDIIYGSVTAGGSFGIGLQRGTGGCYDKVASCAVAPVAGTKYTFTAAAAISIPDYILSPSSGASIVPGTTDIGNHCDDCATAITLPFPVAFYDQIFNNARVASNGLLQFTSDSDGCCGYCLPQTFVSDIIAAHWSDLYTSDTAGGQGIFTSISGTAPNRIFNIEWRATYCCNDGPPTENFEVRLYENRNRIDIIYGSVTAGDNLGIGLQRGTGLCNYTAVSCGTVPTAGTQYTFVTTAQIAAASSTIQAEGCTPLNGAIDPGETVTVSFCVQNVGGQSTSNLVGMLQATGGVTNPSEPQAYGTLAPGQTVCRSFTFTASGKCGGTLNATIHLQDGSTDMGDLTYPFTLGPSAAVLSEGFNDITTLGGAGWYLQNNSQPLGTTAWFQGDVSLFAAQSGSPNSYIAADFRNGSGTATISNWLLTPSVTLHDGDRLIFWTRTVTNLFYPDRLQVRMSTNGSSVNVGVSATDVGDFTTLLVDINPTYTTTGYPTTWTQFTATVTGVPSPATGRLAFRYFVENAGPNGTNSDFIGIDTVSYNIAPTCATSCAPLVLSAVSRKSHGGAGNFDVDLPLTGTPGIECRSGGATNDYAIVITFSGDVIVSGSPQAQITLGSATVGTGGVSNGGMVTVSGNTVTIPLTNVANAQTINVRLNGVNNASGKDAVAADVTIAMSRLLGDTNGNGAVSSADAAQIKAAIGQALTSSNFRSDLNVNGTINSGDVAIIKSAIGTGLP